MTAQLASKTFYSPREFGERLSPRRSGQWVLVRIWQGKLEATRTGGGWRLSHQELRRFGGQDLEVPGHELRDDHDEKLRELRACLADIGVKYARAQQIVAELGGR